MEKAMATHSSTLAWKTPGMAEPGRLLSMGSHRVGHDWRDIAAAAACCYIYFKVKSTTVQETINNDVCMHAQSLQLCPIHSPPGSSVHGIFWQEYWSGSPCPPQGHLPHPGIKPVPPASPALQADSLPLSHQGSLSPKIMKYIECVSSI